MVLFLHFCVEPVLILKYNCFEKYFLSSQRKEDFRKYHKKRSVCVFVFNLIAFDQLISYMQDTNRKRPITMLHYFSNRLLWLLGPFYAHHHHFCFLFNTVAMRSLLSLSSQCKINHKSNKYRLFYRKYRQESKYLSLSCQIWMFEGELSFGK